MEVFNRKKGGKLSIGDDVFVAEYEMKGRIISIDEDPDEEKEAIYTVKLNNGDDRHFTAESLSEAK